MFRYLVINQYFDDTVFVSTIRGFDTGRYETAIQHPDYNDGDIIIVASGYESMEAAEEGHNKWVEIMTSDILPESIPEMSDSGIAILGKITGAIPMEHERKKSE